jgi:protein tyrosine phosphatase (PTP) superfamily phosphohydrolase (DUF442 family)
LLSVALACAAFNGIDSDQQPSHPAAPRARPEQNRPDPAKVEALGLHNVYRITDRLYSGSSPDGVEGFRSLKQLGIKTVISVDGAEPDAAAARKFGLRYVHLPFGYDGIPREQVLRLARAVRDLPGPVYIHCHHGKHRGPAAAATIHLCLDDKCTVGQALAEMRRAGTDPHYTGLYAVPRTLVRPSAKDLDAVPIDFSEVAKVPDLAHRMVEIDAHWENLKLIQAAGWKTPSDHTDLDPPHEALQLAEQFHEAARLAPVKERPDEFRHWLSDAEKSARTLEISLRAGKDSRAARQAGADQAFRKSATSCTQCHAKYRDVPR